MALLIDENVLGLQIAVDDARFVQVVECKSHFSCVETGAILVETTFLLLQMKEEFASIYKLHDHVQAILILEGKLEPHNERMIKLLQDLSLNYFK